MASRLKASVILFSAGFLAMLAAMIGPACAQSEGKTVYIEKARNYVFCEIGLVYGKPPDVYAEVYNTTGISDCAPDKFDAIDPKALAEQFKASAILLNPRHWWMMDHLTVHDAGATRDLAGIKATWMARLPLPPELVESVREGKKGFGQPYRPGVIHRNTKYEYAAGKPVYLMRDTNGHVYVMQTYAQFVNKDINEDMLPKLGDMLSLPLGWRFEAKVLDKDLTVVPAGNVAHVITDDFQDVYDGCGFDTACSYMP